ncbi:MAG: serine protein kinase RIO, partial [Candidatus Nitrosotenuis sp.]|nr:serine protein kinase RIO [Candidatus Nitrosotenuis sp.]
MSSDDYFDTKDYPEIDDFADSDLASKFDNLSVTKKKSLQDGFKKFKTVNQVLDKSTMFTMYEMINAKIIAYVNGIVRAGKESVLFWAVDKDGVDVALKVYLVSTTSFKKRAQYVVGDPRFSRIKSGTKNMVYLWAKKEFRNLQVCYKKGIPTVRPIHVS